MILILMVEGARAEVLRLDREDRIEPPIHTEYFRPGSLHHQDQDHRSPREEVLRMDRWLYPVLPVYLPADVDLQAGVRRVRTLHCPQKVLLNNLSLYFNIHSVKKSLYVYIVIMEIFNCTLVLIKFKKKKKK